MNVVLGLALIMIAGLGLGGVLIWLSTRRPRLTHLILGVVCLIAAVAGFRAGHHLLSPVLFAALAAHYLYMAIWNREAST